MLSLTVCSLPSCMDKAWGSLSSQSVSVTVFTPLPPTFPLCSNEATFFNISYVRVLLLLPHLASVASSSSLVSQIVHSHHQDAPWWPGQKHLASGQYGMTENVGLSQTVCATARL